MPNNKATIKNSEDNNSQKNQKSKPATKAKTNNAGAKLEKLGLSSSMDFALHTPLRYEDETKIIDIKTAIANSIHDNQPVQIVGKVVATSWARGMKQQFIVEVSDETGSINLRFINAHIIQIKQFVDGSVWRIRGEVKHGMSGWEIIHPICKPNHANTLPKNLTAIYSTIAGLPQSYLQACMQTQVKLFVNYTAETIPQMLLDNELSKFKFMSLGQAINTIHFPNPNEDVDALAQRYHPAWQRVKFDELLSQQLSLKKIHLELQKQTAYPLKNEDNSLLNQFLGNLPFKLTEGQQKAWYEISQDLNKAYPMQRLLQGDVGSGKTIVAGMAVAQAVGNGFQVAIMAPTEILAQQLYDKFKQWLEPLGIDVHILLSSVTAKNKRELKKQIASGEAKVVVGTHAIIQKDVKFHNLALAIVDEQHRFGVLQRLALRAGNNEDDNLNDNNKNLNLVHQLMMSATPIPRSLAMSYYANLDVSVMQGLPHGRSAILTKLIDQQRRDELIAKLQNTIDQGRQIYWVCPLIEESESLDLENAQATFELLCERLPNNIKVGLLHGKLPAKQKQEIMLDFKEHRLHILVSTTVIEVGVDVPNASLMIIEHAERFGLAQLHQLRGRVGRGEAKSVCILLYQNPLSSVARQRLEVMYNSQNGFEIADKDLEIRGAGELLGSRQSGDMLRFADVNKDSMLLEEAKKIALIMLENYPEYVERHLNLWIKDKIQYIFA
jgi:ATP-dependent DNA helicase RecG